jgi:hypothetical protein
MKANGFIYGALPYCLDPIFQSRLRFNCWGAIKVSQILAMYYTRLKFDFSNSLGKN